MLVKNVNFLLDFVGLVEEIMVGFMCESES